MQNKSNEIFTEEETLNSTLKYFDGDELAAKVFIDKYALKDNNGNILESNPSEMHRRLAREFSRIEKNKFKNPLEEQEIFDLFDKFKYICPQGGPMFGIGNDFQTISLSNCYVSSIPQDCYSGILKTDFEIAQISKRRGGIGTDLSYLRPLGSVVKNAAKSSTGIPAWMERYSNTIREVGQNNRRGALMLTISVHHPDSVKIDEKEWENPKKIILKGNKEKFERDIITDSRFFNYNNLDFCSIKLDRSKVTGANISIKLSNEFLKAVKDGTTFEQCFPIDYKETGVKPLISIMVDARKVWKKIIHCAWQSAEPGLIFWDNIIENNAIDCYGGDFKTVSTNPCSELPLPEYDSCRLIVQNLFSYIKNPFTKDAEFDYDLFSKHAFIAQRLMDDLIDLELEKIDSIINKIKEQKDLLELNETEILLWKNIKKLCYNGRRTGLGTTGLGDTLAALNVKYASEESFPIIEKIFKCQKHSALESSIEMAKEIGPFPIWNWDIEKNSKFLLKIKSENENLYNKIKKYGRRNIGLLTCAPTGSVSCLTQTTSGIEPLFSLYPYIRRKKINYDDKTSKIDFVDAKGDKWQEFKVYHPKVKLWMGISKNNELEKSPWYNCCANDLDWKNRVKLQSIAQQHIDHAISSTLNLPVDVSEEKIAEIYETAWESKCKGITVYREGCRSGVLISQNNKVRLDKIIKTSAPKRPEILKSDVHHLVNKYIRYYVCVGLLENEPYEIFVGVNSDGNGDIVIPKVIKEGNIKKISRGNYVLIDGESEYKLNNGHSDPTAEALTRILSSGLRHGVDISILVHQLQKTEGDMQSFAKVLARTLKKYIIDGTKVFGENCPSCGSSSLEMSNGCFICKSCGFSKCS